MFYFVVHHLRWLARIPGFPQVFDALLLAWTCVSNRRRLAAMEALEAAMLRLPGMELRVHRFGGTEFFWAGREIGHVHGHGLLDLRAGLERAADLIAKGRARPHHILGRAGWISFQMESEKDVPWAVELLRSGAGSGTGLRRQRHFSSEGADALA